MYSKPGESKYDISQIISTWASRQIKKRGLSLCFMDDNLREELLDLEHDRCPDL
jgi:hypothetical protein